MVALTSTSMSWGGSDLKEVKPRGAPKSILDLAGERLSIARMRPRDIGISVAKDKLALAVTEYNVTPRGKVD